MKTIVIGLGNPILGDDAVGWKVVEQLQDDLQHAPLEVTQQVDTVFLSIGGLSLMEHLIGYDLAIIVDAINSGEAAPGTVTIQELEEMQDVSAGHTTSTHDTSLLNSVRLARQMGIHLPEKIFVIAVESSAVFDFSEKITVMVTDAIPEAVGSVWTLLRT